MSNITRIVSGVSNTLDARSSALLFLFIARPPNTPSSTAQRRRLTDIRFLVVGPVSAFCKARWLSMTDMSLLCDCYVIAVCLLCDCYVIAIYCHVTAMCQGAGGDLR